MRIDHINSGKANHPIRLLCQYHMLSGVSPYVPDFISTEDRNAVKRVRDWDSPRTGFGVQPALLVIDMTESELDKEFPFGDDGGSQCAENVRALALLCRKKSVPVIYTKLVSAMYADHPALKGRWKAPNVSKSTNERGKAIYHGLKPEDGDIVIEKDKASAFFGTQLASILTYLGIDTVIVTGVTTSGCVRATVCDAFQFNYRVIVPEECVYDGSKISHQVSLFDMDARYADVLKLDRVLKYVSGLRKETRGIRH